MAGAQWSKLPKDIVLLIANILSSDVDNIRLRSVCSHWRSSIRRRYRPSSFPLQVPPPLFLDRVKALPNGSRFYLRYTTIYRLSPPEFGPCAGDPSDGFLLRVSEVRPNTFSLLPLLHSKIDKSDSKLALKRVNLLDFRVSEICRSYVVECVSSEIPRHQIARAVVIWNYDVDCAFMVVVLVKEMVHYWKFGDQDWVTVDNGERKLNDFLFFDGKYYAIGSQGRLLVADSKFNLTVVPSLPRLPVSPRELSHFYFYLTVYKSELYILSFPRVRADNISAEAKVFKKGNGIWEHIKCLGDKMFLFCDDVIFGLSSKDFHGCKNNCMYLSPKRAAYGDEYEIAYSEYDLGEHWWTRVRKGVEEAHSVISKPPPKWLLSS